MNSTDASYLTNSLSCNGAPLWSEAPHWANWLARSADGWWYWMEAKTPPTLFNVGDQVGYWPNEYGLRCTAIIPADFYRRDKGKRYLPILEPRP